MRIAKEISDRIKRELGVTVSIGVSWNKIFAKLASDYKKPDAITEFNRANYKEVAWKLPVGDLLYVGHSTNRKLKQLGVQTIGDLANMDPALLQSHLGKMGFVLHAFANGYDESPVNVEGYEAPIKSIGNSTTTPRDLTCNQDVKIILIALAESVAARLRENGFQCRVVEVSIRESDLCHFTRQKKLERPTDITSEIVEAAYSLFTENYHWRQPVRSLGIRGADLISGQIPYQLDLFMSQEQREKQEKVDQAVDEIRRRFGYYSIQRAYVYQDQVLAKLDAKNDHTVHPHGFFHG
jgi:DNA polymerase-4